MEMMDGGLTMVAKFLKRYLNQLIIFLEKKRPPYTWVAAITFIQTNNLETLAKHL